jgi:uncharacterized repeat protein (TIGR02543 family)
MLIMVMVLCGTLAVTSAYAGNHSVANETDFDTALTTDTDPVINITVTANITITSSKTIPPGKTVNLTSDGIGAGRKILLRDTTMVNAGYSSTTSQLFRVDGGILNLSNIILDGANINANSELILNGGDVTLGNGATLRNNRNMSGDNAIGPSRSTGGAITVFPGWDSAASRNATLTILDGAEISNNVAALGCGVVLYSGTNGTIATYRAIATMEGGSIHGNHAFIAAGVYVVQNATFYLNGGEIYDNHATMGDIDFLMAPSSIVVDPSVFQTDATTDGDPTRALSTANIGGGVFTTATASDFYMSGGKIYNNTAMASLPTLSGRGGGIEAASYGRNFVITGGEIYGNSASDYGGGISAYRSFTISGDTQIYNNTSARGGGIFQMFNGVIPSSATINDNVQIKGNTASAHGGGFYTYDGSTVSLNDQIQVTGNIAALNGGGIWVSYAGLANVDVAATVTFANNHAQAAYLIADIDKPTHIAHVHTTSFTKPFDQPAINWGYNNYDIAYINGTLNYVVSFDSVGGSAVDPQLVAPNAMATQPTAPTRPGHSFQDWYVDSGYSATYDFLTLVTSDRTLYANWLPFAYTTASIPTTSGGILAALGVLLAGLAAGTLRRRQR